LGSLNPDHLLEQADRLVLSVSTGPPRQVDLRRAISSAYYGLFHAILTAAADEFVGSTKRTTSHYTLVYRSVDHKAVRQLCLEIVRSPPSARYGRHAPPGGYGTDLQAFAEAVLDLQERRHAADYDPSIQLTASGVVGAITVARRALECFRRAGATKRKAFLTLLLFQPR
jgi:hypothetical protein